MVTMWFLAFLALPAQAQPAAKAADAPDEAKLWGRWERTFTAGDAGDPETEIVAELTSPTGKKTAVDGFWDGGTTWKIRFMPHEEGLWSFTTKSSPPAGGLTGISGKIRVSKETDGNAFHGSGALRVSKSGTHLEHADGTPFFWLGDTCWNGTLFSTKEDWAQYLDTRAAQGFTVIQFNVMAPWRAAPSDAEGETAFSGLENVKIRPQFFRRLDERMEALAQRGLVAAPVLIWSLTRKDPGNYLPEKDLVRLARTLVARYQAHHVVWVLAGDNPYDKERAERWKVVGRAVFGSGARAPVTTHPTGMNWPWESFREESWLTVLGYQSGHGDSPETLQWIHSGPPARNWSKSPARPVINLEPPYEGHLSYQSRKPHSDYNVRRAVYWSLLSTPIAGVTYGGHGVWSWHEKPGQEPTDHPGTGAAPVWRDALNLPGAKQMTHAAKLLSSLAWWMLRPDPALVMNQSEDPAKFIAASRTEKGNLALFYLPVGGELRVKKGEVLDTAEARWFDPRRGEYTPAKRNAPGVLEAPSTDDWLLIVKSS